MDGGWEIVFEDLWERFVWARLFNLFADVCGMGIWKDHEIILFGR